MKTLYFSSFLFVIVFLTSGCSPETFSRFSPVYRIDVQQGNVITQEMLSQLRVGMDRNKVKFIMGTPLLADPFHLDRWDYVYTFKKGHGQLEERHISLHFKDDQLEYVSGDITASANALNVPRRQGTSVTVPGEKEDSIFESLSKGIGFGDDENEQELKETAETVKEGASDSPSLEDVGLETPAVLSEGDAGEENGFGGMQTMSPADGDEDTAASESGIAPASGDEELQWTDSEPADTTVEVPDNPQKDKEEKGFFGKMMGGLFGSGDSNDIPEGTGPDEQGIPQGSLDEP